MIYLLPICAVFSVILSQVYYFYRFKALEHKIDIALEKKVDEVLQTLKTEVPMGNTFLRGSLEEKLRQKALNLVKKIVPDLKDQKGGWSLLWFPILIALMVSIFFVFISILLSTI